MSEYRHEFVQALRQGKSMRKCIFGVLEQRHAKDFANGQIGVKYYNDMFDAVQAADVPEALEEFESRFFPLLDPDGSRARAAAAIIVPKNDAPPRARREGRWAMAAFGAVALVAGSIYGLKAVAHPPKPEPVLAAATTSVVDTQPIVTVTEVTTDAAAVATEEPAKEPTKAPADE